MQAIQIYFELNPSIGAIVTMAISEGFYSAHCTSSLVELFSHIREISEKDGSTKYTGIE
jgi:hypothetical protein